MLNAKGKYGNPQGAQYICEHLNAAFALNVTQM
jgi:hypothetical protein